ncbi:hypothetical protein Bcav_1174 [Beutenbergia cavernae DSM 12333]|uniref:DUF6752 domain-containing protein n=1 Tax=Beutenbergia cavernae (strain ATCC BAA-8 / DSM 12333 / CCUG 43141 / JCM 11478 / NBRC 16432 / NCIMB 13614 / HKI 0122) TaxID=471853 RepID=C5C130_BEUC1|nr:DUF6752 domain-containing protein [Beutenbergia cavernae]ACQ79434.1 hypothetical protein Bcav_1174 [Beutenbergia cavernae DSM 12333]
MSRLTSALDARAPSVASALRGVRDRLPRSRTRRDIADLRAQLDELREEIDECRRDSLRIAELTDIVETRLAQPRPEGA